MKLKSLFAGVVALLTMHLVADTWTDQQGYAWSYTVIDYKATITGVSPKKGSMPVAIS